MFNFVKKHYPLLFLFVVWFVFSSPYFLKGKIPYPANYQVNNFSPWNSYQEFAGPVKNGAMPDVITQIYPWKTLTIESLKNFQIPLWNPYSFSGSPFLANYQSAVLTPFNLLFLLPLKFIDSWSLLILLQPLMAGIFMFLFARSLNLSKVGSLISSVSFMFCGFITAWMAYGTLGYAILFLPLALFSIEKYLKTNSYKYLIIFSLSFPLSFFSGHFQTSVYFFGLIISYLLFKLFTKENSKKIFALIYFLIIGILISSPQLLSSFEFYSNSVRSGLFQKIEAIPWGYLPTLLAPDFLGNPVTRNDWFGHYAEWNAYAGVLPLALASYILFNRRKRELMFFSIIAVVSFLLAFDSPLLNLMVNLKIPVLSTSAASRIIVLFSFSIAILSAFGFDFLTKDIKEKKLKKIFLWLFVSLMLFISLWVVVLLKLGLDSEKLAIAKSNLIFPTLIMLAGLIAIIVSNFNKKIFYILGFAVLLLVSFDLLRFSTKWQPFDPKHLVFPDVKITNFFKTLSSPYRVFGNFGAEDSVYYRLPSTEGYEPLHIQRYGRFIESISDGKAKDASRYVVSLPKNGKYTSKAIDFLGIKYFVHKVSDGRAVWAFPVWEYPDHQFNIIFEDEKYQVFENKNVFPRAYFVNGYKVVENEQEIITTMFADEFNLREEVVLEKSPRIGDGNGGGSAVIKDYQNNKVHIKTRNDKDSLLLLSDVYYPGWEVFVDGVPKEIFRANHSFRAVVVPKGEHDVEFVYKPWGFEKGKIISGIGLALMFASLTFFRKKG